MHKPIIIAISVLVILAAGTAVLFQFSNRPEQVFCTQEAKQCPDGTFVGRTGPKCEFAACPSAGSGQVPADNGNEGSIILNMQIGKSASALGVTITPQEVLEDSRCPRNVLCVWAGRVRLRAMLKSGLGEASQVFILGEPITTEAEEIALTGVEPAPFAGVAIAPEDYRFTFMVKKRGAPGTGTIRGKVDVGPICPVEQEGVPCPVPPEAYTSRQIVIYAADGTTEIVRKAISPGGAYSLALPAGSYVLDIVHQGIDRGSDLPHPFALVPDETETFDFSIDTGIR